MARIYLSSTYDDLEKYRATTYRTLDMLDHDVRAMENYVAADQRPLAKCLKDVASSQIYIGLFAWRYGYIPPRNNSKKKSITELEFRQASKLQLERLIFLANDNHPWQPNHMDAVTGEGGRGRKIRTLREELRAEMLCSFFTTPDNLATQVSVAVSMATSREPVGHFKLPSELTDVRTIRRFGSTLTPEIIGGIKKAMDTATGSRVIEVDLGNGKTWWSTRLFLLAALAEEYTQIETLMFVDGKRKFVGMAAPEAVRRALAQDDPRLEDAYRQSPPSAERRFAEPEEAVVYTAQEFRGQWGATEAEVKVWVTPRRLRSMLGNELIADAVKLDTRIKPDVISLFSKIVGHSSTLVPLIQDGQPMRVMDRVELATKIAASGLRNIRL